MTGALKNIIYNCRAATLLIEKRMLGEITAVETLKLRIHLAGCSFCRTYQQQSLLINRLFTGFPSPELKLDEEFMASLKQKIEKEINKN